MQPQSLETKVTQIAVSSRLLVIIIQAISNNLFPDHDAKVFSYPQLNETQNILDGAIEVVLGGFVRWDAHYFMHISIHGYTYENCIAFFPLLPFIINTLTTLFSPVLHIMSLHSLTLLLFIIFNFIIFIQAAKVLFKLTLSVFNEEFAIKTVWLYCFNPASIFFTAPYTECLFSYLTLTAILYCFKLKLLQALIFIALSACTRSNGLINFGFFFYFYFLKRFKSLELICAFFTSTLPYHFIQFYYHSLFCRDFSFETDEVVRSYGLANNFLLPGNFSKSNQPWCSYKFVPNPYGYVQEKYWNVGFLSYYEVKQIPNFLLASPIIFIMLYGGYNFFNKHRMYLIHYGIFKSACVKLKIISKDYKRSNYEIDKLFVCVFHGIALTIFCVLFVHIQVTTRLICSASPVIYWFGAVLPEKWIKIYFLGYFCIGTCLFANHLPWT